VKTMPLKKKRNTKKILIWIAIIILVALMVMYFSPTQTTIELELYP
jgi:predicted nucleic acid-binding Zn ribbon protein